MALQKYELWRQTGKQLHEDPFELAMEEASLKLLHSVCNIFYKGHPFVSSSSPPYTCAENHRKLQTKQHMHGGVHCPQFATASLTLAPTTKYLCDEDSKNDTLRGVCRTPNQLLTKDFTCIPINKHQQDGGTKDDTHTGVCEPSNESATPLSNRFSSQISVMASLTFAPINKYQQGEDTKEWKQEISHPSSHQLLKHPLAILSYIPKDASLFLAGAVAGATAKTVTAPLDRIKLLMQVHGVKAAQEITKKSIGFFEAAMKIGKEDGMQGYWKGNLPQVIRVIPYSAVQLLSYELYKKLFKGNDKELSVACRLAAGACAGMTSTLVTYPLDVLRLRLAVDPACKSMVQVASTMLREEGLSSFYRGLGPSLLGIAPYIALNFCAFDLIKKSLPEEVRKTPAASFLTAFLSASLATTLCYPLDTVRRQLQMKGTPYLTVLDAFPGIIAKDGVLGLYRGFVPNALKNLPNSSIRLTTFDAAKNLISASQEEFQRLLNERRGNPSLVVDIGCGQKSIVT